jgi:hypothetical protein
MSRRSSKMGGVGARYVGSLAIALLLGLNGCAELRLYDASKATLAKSAKDQLAEAKVSETIDVAIANSKQFLDESERIAALEGDVRKERALLAIAESGNAIATWLEARWKEQAQLGFENTATAHARLQANTEVETTTKQAEKNRDRLKSYAKDSAVGALLIGPLCQGIVADSSPPDTKNLDPFDLGTYKKDFAAYRKSCVALAEKKAAVPKDIVTDSALDLAQKERADVLKDQDSQKEQFNEAKRKLDAARKELAAAKQTNTTNPDDLKEKADTVSKETKDFLALADKFGFKDAPLDNIKDLAVILGAVSSGQVDKDAVKNNESLAKAALAASKIPSLSADATALIESGKAPPTGHLILELNHQQILYNRALAFSNLRIEEIALHDGKIAALEEQAAQFREIQYALCNYAVMKANGEHQRDSCAHLSFENGGKTCKVGPPGNELTIGDCILAKSWRENYEGTNKPREKRQLLTALLAYSRALDAQTTVRKTDFEIINLGYKRVAASDRAAIAAWNNLVAVPVDTLSAYHEAGIKPDTIATAAAQLLGLLGIAAGIGASK